MRRQSYGVTCIAFNSLKFPASTFDLSNTKHDRTQCANNELTRNKVLNSSWLRYVFYGYVFLGYVYYRSFVILSCLVPRIQPHIMRRSKTRGWLISKTWIRLVWGSTQEQFHHCATEETWHSRDQPLLAATDTSFQPLSPRVKAVDDLRR